MSFDETKHPFERFIQGKSVAVLSLVRSFYDTWIKRPGHISYSQCGEDLIMKFACEILHIEKPSYLDIGAHHATYLNNTYLFYAAGCSGICVEADPILSAEIAKIRPRDNCLNVGVAPRSGEADFFIMSSKTLNTFSREEATRYESYGQAIEKVVRLPVTNVTELLKKHTQRPPNIVSLDVEGLDFAILESFDFSYCRPEVFCIETLTYAEDKTERKLNEIIDLMHDRGYFTYADTYINSIFIDRRAWERR